MEKILVFVHRMVVCLVIGLYAVSMAGFARLYATSKMDLGDSTRVLPSQRLDSTWAWVFHYYFNVRVIIFY